MRTPRRGGSTFLLVHSAKLTIGACLFTLMGPAQAGPPLITNDPDTPGPGKWEINLAATGAANSDEWALDVPDLDINRGVGERIQLSIHATWAHARQQGTWGTGLGDDELGLRYRFLDEDTSGVSVAVQPLYVRAWSAAARRRGLASEHPEWVLPLQVARASGTFSTGIEISRHFIAREDDAWQAGAFIGRACFQGDCLAEVNATRTDGERMRATFDIGARHPLREDILLMVSLGRQSGAGEPASSVFYLGLQYLR